MSRTSSWNFAPTDTLRLPKVFKSEVEKIARAVDCGNGAEARAVLDNLLEQYETVETVIEAPQEGEFIAPLPHKFFSPSSIEEVFLEDDEPIPAKVLAQVFQRDFTASSVTTLKTESDALRSDSTVEEVSPLSTKVPVHTSNAPDFVATTTGATFATLESTTNSTQEVAVVDVELEAESALTESTEAQKETVAERSVETPSDVQVVVSDDWWLAEPPHSVTVNINDSSATNGTHSDSSSDCQTELTKAPAIESEKVLIITEEVAVEAPVLVKSMLLQNIVGTSTNSANSGTNDTRIESLELPQSGVEPHSVTALQEHQSLSPASVTESEAKANSVPLEGVVTVLLSTLESPKLSVTESREPLNLPVIIQTTTPLSFGQCGVSSTMEIALKKPEVVAREERQASAQEKLHSVTALVKHSETALSATFPDIVIGSELEVTETGKELTIETLPTLIETERLAQFGQSLFQTWRSLVLRKDRVDQEGCWSVSISIEAVYREGFQSVSMHRFLSLLESLAEAKTIQTYGHLQLSQKGSQESVMLNGTPANKMTYFNPQRSLDQTVGGRSDQTTQTALKAPCGKFEHTRKELGVHVDRIGEQARKTKRKQESEHGDGIIRWFQNLKRFLN